MRKPTSAFIPLIILSMMVGCSQANTPAGIMSHIENISPENTTRITVSTQPSLFDAVELTDPSDVESIVLYLKGLSISETDSNEMGSGMGYLIEIFNNEEQAIKVVLAGNKWIEVDDSRLHTIPYNEAIIFDTIIGNILINKFRDEYEGTIVRGEVKSVSSAESGATIGCEIITDDGTLIVVDMNNKKPIIDITGTGWLILHAGDIVEIGINSNFTADKVFIVEASM